MTSLSSPPQCGPRRCASLIGIDYRLRRAVFALVISALLAALPACSATRYYAQAASGQWSLLRARQPLTQLLADPQTDPALRARLQRVAEARDWAVEALQLPDNGSYRSYADLHRPYVVWNLYATPPLSLAPVEHCFWIVGCVAYQGYYDEREAQAAARGWQQRGDDTEVSGVPAYSTLGWFDDPLLNTMLRWDDATLLETLFHELAHQRVFVPGDTVFNESFAQFVGEQGLRDYRATHPTLAAPDPQAERRRRQFTELVLATRDQLAALYAADLPEAVRRQLKAETLAGLRARYEALRDQQWDGARYYERWFERAPLNNARLVPFGLYDEQLPAFAALYAEVDGDWARFYARAGQLARLRPAARREALRALRQTAEGAR